MVLPNFLLIGSPKSGTTSLYYYLRQHPEIYMSYIKEPHFFAFNQIQPKFNGPNDDQAYLSKFTVTSLSEYKKLFDSVTTEKAIGEASTMYLYLPQSAKQIKYHLPKVKLIAILRNPCDRAFSHYLHLVRDGRETIRDFSLAIAQEEKRIQENWAPAWHYQKVGFYAEQLKRYLDIFDHSQIKIYLYDDWQKDNKKILNDIYQFLGVDPNQNLDYSEQHNKFEYVPKNQILHNFFTKDNSLKSFLKKFIPSKIQKVVGDSLYYHNLDSVNKLDNSTRKKLINLFTKDILHLEKLLDRDLSFWLNDSI